MHDDLNSIINTSINRSIIQIYRAKSYNNKWIKGYIVKIGEGMFIVPFGERIDASNSYFIEVQPNTICRLIDKDLGEVYSGDVVKFYVLDCTALILFSDGLYYMHKKHKDGIIIVEDAITELNSQLFNVIGNVYDNPSLIEEYSLLKKYEFKEKDII